MLTQLANELILNIIEFLAPPRDFATASTHSQPPLKNLSLCSRRLYALCFPTLHRTLRLRLRRDTARAHLAALRAFLASAQIGAVAAVALDLGDEWNAGHVGLELKTLLSALGVASLTVAQARGHASARERCAKWAFPLARLARLRLRTVDDGGALRMLLLRACPAAHVVVDDGDLRAPADAAGVALLHDRRACAALAAMKPALFARLARLEYSATCPSVDRFAVLLEFVGRLPALRELRVTLMAGVALEDVRESDIWFRPTDVGRSYRMVVSQYQRLAAAIEGMDGLRRLEVGDRRVPYHADAKPPSAFTEVETGVYWRL